MKKKLILKLITHMQDYMDMCCDAGYAVEEVDNINYDLTKLKEYFNLTELKEYFEQNKTIS